MADCAPSLAPYPSSAPPAPAAEDAPEDTSCSCWRDCCTGRLVLVILLTLFTGALGAVQIIDQQWAADPSAVAAASDAKIPVHLSQALKQNPFQRYPEAVKAIIDARQEKAAAMASESIYQQVQFQDEFNKIAKQHENYYTAYNEMQQKPRKNSPGPLSRLFWGENTYE